MKVVSSMQQVARQMPKHVAIIMDGNRRWARQRGLPVIMGHRKVVDERIEELIEYAGKLGIAYITFWAFSTENWGRPDEEVSGIMELFRFALQKKARKMIERGARLRVIGDIDRFPPDIAAGVRQMMVKSEQNTKITVTFALNYGGRDEILRAVRELVTQKREVTEENLSACLDTAGMPDPDLIIRTSGEQRLSGLMPWQSVYAELYFPQTLMPDFGAQELDLAMAEYGKRQRRFGKG